MKHYILEFMSSILLISGLLIILEADWRIFAGFICIIIGEEIKQHMELKEQK